MTAAPPDLTTRAQPSVPAARTGGTGAPALSTQAIDAARCDINKFAWQSKFHGNPLPGVKASEAFFGSTRARMPVNIHRDACARVPVKAFAQRSPRRAGQPHRQSMISRNDNEDTAQIQPGRTSTHVHIGTWCCIREGTSATKLAFSQSRHSAQLNNHRYLGVGTFQVLKRSHGSHPTASSLTAAGRSSS